VICFLGLPEMTVSRTRRSLMGAIWAALIFAPAICSAQPTGETGPKADSNLTRQTQTEIDIACGVSRRLSNASCQLLSTFQSS
jgi:hypothetical protein